jgi:hypothetical protein
MIPGCIRRCEYGRVWLPVLPKMHYGALGWNLYIPPAALIS